MFKVCTKFIRMGTYEREGQREMCLINEYVFRCVCVFVCENGRREREVCRFNEYTNIVQMCADVRRLVSSATDTNASLGSAVCSLKGFPLIRSPFIYTLYFCVLTPTPPPDKTTLNSLFFWGGWGGGGLLIIFVIILFICLLACSVVCLFKISILRAHYFHRFVILLYYRYF